MGELARWSLKVSRETDIALRTLLATRGGKKGDMSRFVEDAVNREVLRETVRDIQARNADAAPERSEEHTSELQSLMRISYAVFCLKKKKICTINNQYETTHSEHRQRYTQQTERQRSTITSHIMCNHE